MNYALTLIKCLGGFNKGISARIGFYLRFGLVLDIWTNMVLGNLN